MYQIKKYLGNEYNRINQIIDSFNTLTRTHINLAACCSYPFESVLEAQSAPTYLLPTEGTIGNRFFPDITCIDDIEKYAEEIILDIFKLTEKEYRATTQPHSGTQANQIVYNAILEDGDAIVSLDTKSGGHISHNKFIKNVNVYNFGLTNNNEIDYESFESTIKYRHPKLVIIGASSFPNIIDYQKIIEISHDHGALVLADICHTVLFILGNVYPTPFPNVDFVSFTMDKTLRGPQGGVLIYKADFSNMINYSIFPKTQGGPLQSAQFAKLIGLIELQKIDIQNYAIQVQSNAKIMNNCFIENGYSTFSKDNSTHIVLLDTKQFGITGMQAEKLLFQNKILANKNVIPHDLYNPTITGGIRFGTTYITNQKYSKEDVKMVTEIIIKILNNNSYDESVLESIITKYI